MAKYFYERYSLNYVYSESWSFSGSRADTSFTGWSSYYTSGENFYPYNGQRTITPSSGGTVYTQDSVKTVLYRHYYVFEAGNWWLRTESGTRSFSNYSRGSYVDTIVAEDGTYPSNGISGPYWYVKKGLAPKPTLIQPNGGETITNLFEIRWTNGENVVQENLRTTIEISFDNGSTWKLLAIAAVGTTSYTHDFINENESSLSRIRVKHTTSGNVSGEHDASDGVFTIIRNTPPKAPALIYPVGLAIDRGQVNRLTWRHNDDNIGDAQSKAVLQWKLQGASTWNTINVNSNNNYYDISADVFPLAQIVWRVKTYDQLNAEGPYSDEAQFTAADASDAPVITAPSNIVPIARPTVQWSSSDQVAYQIIILDSLNNAVWDSGEVTSTNKATTIGYDLVNGGLYSIRLRTKNPLNLWTDNAILTITVAYTPPANPVIDVVEINGGLKVRIEHPEPIGTQPLVESAELYRSEDNVNWVRIAENIGSYYDDYTAASGKEYFYRVKAFGVTSTISDSNIAEGSAKLRGVWIHKVSDPNTISQFLYNEDRAQSIGTNGTMMQFAGRKFAIAEYDESESDTFEVTLKIKDDDKLQQLIEFIKSKETLCVRDGRGRKLFCHAFSLPIQDEFYGYSVDLSFERVSYSEVI